MDVSRPPCWLRHGVFDTAARETFTFLVNTAQQDAMWQINRTESIGFEETL